MKKYIDMIDGYKTIIGGILLSISYLVEQFYIGSGFTKPDIVNGIIYVLNGIGTITGATGVAHKMAKYEIEKSKSNQ